MNTRHLWLIRHGKSANAVPGEGDHSRPLNARGHADGELMRGCFAVHTVPAEWIWISTARRAQETAVYVAGGFPDAESTSVDPLYLADPETLLECAQQTPGQNYCAAIIAHNPGLTYLVNLLTGSNEVDGLPTFGSVLIEFSDCADWYDLRFGSGRIQQYIKPRFMH